MRCEELALRVSQSADSGLNPEAAAELAEHLRACPACLNRWRALQQAESILSGAPLVAPPAGFGQRVMASVARERALLAARQDPARRSLRVAIAAAGVAMVFVAAGSVVIGASLAWNVEALAGLAAHSLTLSLVEVSGTLVSVDALARAVAVVWSALPAPAGQAILGAAGLGSLALLFSWARLVGRFGWSLYPAGAR
jgi:anti-sigma factor RsiW